MISHTSCNFRNQQKDLFWNVIQKSYTFHGYLKKLLGLWQMTLQVYKLKIKLCKSSKVEQNNVITGCPQDSKTEVNITSNLNFVINLDSYPIEICNIPLICQA